MIGVSLPYSWLTGESRVPDLDVDKTLATLKVEGVSQIELRTILPHHDPEEVLRISEMLGERGFSVSIHSYMHTRESAVKDVFGPLCRLLEGRREVQTVIVLHLLDEDNAPILRSLAEYAEQEGYNVVIAAENNRLMPNGEEGDSAEFVLDAVTRAEHRSVGICFDLGHYIYYVKKHGLYPEKTLPRVEFLNKIVHTHIHALDGLKTHFPLHTGELPLSEMLEPFSYKFFGAYNLELDFPRLEGLFDPEEALVGSVRHLISHLPPLAKLYRRIRLEYKKDLSRALSVYNEKPSGTLMGLANPTFYLFNTGGYLWAMDPAFRFVNHLTDAKDHIAGQMKDVSLMVVTHGHVDHFEEEAVRELGKTEMTWIIPDFMYDDALGWGIRPEKIIVAHQNEPICIDKLTFLPFEGRHFRPVTKKGVPAYGYLVTAEGSPSMAFPADVRDFSLEGLPELPPADVVFSHVFLGDGAANDSDFGDKPEEVARFFLHFSKKHIVFAHLYENGRRYEDMWRPEHARLIADAALSHYPDLRISIPEVGDHILL